MRRSRAFRYEAFIYGTCGAPLVASWVPGRLQSSPPAREHHSASQKQVASHPAVAAYADTVLKKATWHYSSRAIKMILFFILGLTILCLGRLYSKNITQKKRGGNVLYNDKLVPYNITDDGESIHNLNIQTEVELNYGKST